MRTDGRGAALAFCVLLAFFFILRPSIRGNDGVQNYSYLHSLLFDHDLNFTNEYAHYFAQEAGWFDEKDISKLRDPNTGLPINMYGVGNSVLWAPWVLFFHFAARLGNLFGAKFLLDGYSRIYEVAVGAGSCFYASLGIMLLFRLLRSRFGNEAAFWPVMLVWLASPLFFYMYLHPSMSHANSFFLSAMLLAVYMGGDGFTRWLVLGGIAGLLTSVRFQDAGLLLAFAPVEFLRLRECPMRDWSSRFARWGLLAAGALAAFAPQFAAWHVLHGSAFSGPRGYAMQAQLRLYAPVHVLDVLFSPRHGLFYWHPGLLLGVAGLVLPGNRTRERLVCFTAFAIELWVIASWSHWWAGASFGHRMFIGTLPFLALGAAFLMAKVSGSVSGWLAAALVLLILWNFGCIVQYGAGMIDRQGPVSLTTLWSNNVFRVPRMLLGIR